MNLEHPGYKEYKCAKCSWVHAAIPQSAVPRDGDVSGYFRCFHCRAPSCEFVPAEASDATDGCSLQPIVVAGAWGDSTAADADDL